MHFVILVPNMIFFFLQPSVRTDVCMATARNQTFANVIWDIWANRVINVNDIRVVNMAVVRRRSNVTVTKAGAVYYAIKVRIRLYIIEKYKIVYRYELLHAS